MKQELSFLEHKEKELQKEMYYYNIDDRVQRRMQGLFEDYKYLINKLLEENEGK